MELEPELLEAFTVESMEHLEAVEPLLIELEQGAQAGTDAYNRIFRALHSIKGTAGFLGLDRIQSLSHLSESLLMRLRDGELAFEARMADPLLRVIDALRRMVAALPTATDYPAGLRAELERILDSGADAPRAATTAAADPPRQSSDALLTGELCVELGYLTPAQSAEVLAAQGTTNPRRCFGSVAQSLGYMDQSEVAEALAEQMIRLAQHATAAGARAEPTTAPRENAAPPEPRPATGGDGPAPTTVRARGRNETIRVAVPLLDRLMDLAGELVLSRNQLRRQLEGEAQPGLKTTLQRMDQVTSELQEGIMNTRMQPLRKLFDKLPRMVRDIAQKLGKEVDLVLEGGDVELDRSLLESLSDPLTHLLRNALDHGVEPPAERAARGKPPNGTVAVRAYHAGGQVLVEFRDDGRGIDGARVKAKAVERGILAREDADAMTGREAIQLVFRAGLSTAADVTDVSGRGVGMDVVRANILRLGGSIELESSLGRGTAVRIRLPLTLAIIPSLIVASAGQRFAIPQVSLAEVVRVRSDEVASRLHAVRGVDLLRTRDRLLPIVRLDRVLGLEAADGDRGQDGRDVDVVILETGGGSYGLVVDTLHDIEEIVVKPLSAYVGSCEWFAGATILGDGTVATIIDVHGLVRLAGLDLRRDDDPSGDDAPTEDASDARSLLIFNVAARERFALPLGDLQRLERVEPEQIERVGAREYFQHGGRALPLIRLDRLLPVGPLDATAGALFALIPREADGSAGILASRIVDTRTSDVAPTDGTGEPGLAGRAILDGHLTHFLDTAALLRAASSETTA